MVFLGLISQFSAVYNLGFAKSATSMCLVCKKFVADHVIPELFITYYDQSEVKSDQWKV